jgi:hypothetical protein
MEKPKIRMQICLSPHVAVKLHLMEQNAIKIYGKKASMSAIIETLIVKASDRKTQVISRIRSIQKELLDLDKELTDIKEKEGENEQDST